MGSNRKIPIDIRLIAATNRDLPELVKQSLFREDLYYRINTIQIEIPPLRNRREDIPLFIDYFLKKYTALYNQPGLTIHPQAAAKLERYDWPGNIRELQHTIEKAVILAEKNVIRAADLFIRPGKSVSFSDAPNLGEVERKTIEAAITQNDGNLTAAAEYLDSACTILESISNINVAFFPFSSPDQQDHRMSLRTHLPPSAQRRSRPRAASQILPLREAFLP